MNRPKWIFWICVCCFGNVWSQTNPFRQMQMANTLQQRNNMLQQTMLQNLLNPSVVQLQGRTPDMSQSFQLMNQLSRMTQNMMNNLNTGTQTVMPTVGANNRMTVDALLRQQRNLQERFLQNVQTRPNTNVNGPAIQNVGFNRNQNLTTEGPRLNAGANDFSVTVVTRNDSTIQSNPGNTIASTSNNLFDNTTFGDIFSNFGGFSFPSASANFWTGNTEIPGSTAVGGNQQATDVASSIFPSAGGVTNLANQQSTGSASSIFPSAGGITNLANQQPTGSASSIFPSAGGFTNLRNQQTSRSQTTFDPATGITFGRGFTPDQSTFGTESQTSGTSFGGGQEATFGVGTQSGGPTFGGGRTTGQQTMFGTGPRSIGSSIGSGASTFGINIPGGFTTRRQTAGTQSSTTGTQTSGGRSAIAQDALLCTAEYKAISGHTVCMTDSPLLTRAGVDIDDRLRITQMHNHMRARVQPPAADLVTLQWDDRIAAVAQKWAKQCKLAHDTEREIPDMGMSMGQNVAVGFETWQEAMRMWYDEISMYRYGLQPDSYLGTDGWRQIAHFTQIVQNATYLLGCGYAECPETQYVRYYVCNYAAGQTDLAYPYTAGSRCESCPNNCNNGLCDCGGLVCFNGGSLDSSTCKCECPKPYNGERCENVNCPVSDNWICGRDWPPSYCDQFYNVPEECPYMCGICGGGSSITALTTPNVTTFTSSFGCRYTGVRDDKAMCRTYGENGTDMRQCASEGGTVGCAECERYFNIKKDYCPVMCGLCDTPCVGKRCSNGGTLDANSCSCRCRKPFTGDTCEFAQCPINGDPGFCKFWPPKYCQMYYNVPEECPYMCGICKPDNVSVSVRGRPKRMEEEVGNPMLNVNGSPIRLGDAPETRRK